MHRVLAPDATGVEEGRGADPHVLAEEIEPGERGGADLRVGDDLDQTRVAPVGDAAYSRLAPEQVLRFERPALRQVIERHASELKGGDEPTREDQRPRQRSVVRQDGGGIAVSQRFGESDRGTRTDLVEDAPPRHELAVARVDDDSRRKTGEQRRLPSIDRGRSARGGGRGDPRPAWTGRTRPGPRSERSLRAPGRRGFGCAHEQSSASASRLAGTGSACRLRSGRGPAAPCSRCPGRSSPR